MSSRSRYDTTALVLKLQRERRRGLVLGFTAASIIIALVLIYFVTMRGNNIPQVPGDVAPRPASDVPPIVTSFGVPGPPVAETALPTGSAMASPVSAPVVASGSGLSGSGLQTVAPPAPAKHLAPAPPSPTTPGFLRASFPKSATVFLDTTQLGRSSGQSMLEPGPHVVKAKIGKKTYTQKIEVKPGENLAVSVDKKGKISVERK